MNLNQSIKRSVLIAVALVLEAVDERITAEQNRLEEATQKPLRKPLSSSPSKYDTVTADTARINTANISTGIITSTTSLSKYTPEQLQSFYKINPYTNFNN